MWGFKDNYRSVTTGRRGQRREERFTTDTLSSTLGEVVDLSGVGARVRCVGRPAVAVGQLIPLKLSSSQCHITLKSRVVRIHRTGLRSFDVGLAFIEVRPGLRAALHNLARFGFIPGLESREQQRANPSIPRPAIPDLYGLLRISPDATPQQVREAYRVAARKYHPDANRTPEQAFMFQAVTEAYHTLRDPEKRQEYDTRRARAAAAA